MPTRGEKAKELFLSGYNCTQCIAITFCDVLGLTPEVAAQISSGFGGGFGRLREVCGAFSGITMVLGAVNGYNNPNDNEQKKLLYKSVQAASQQFIQVNGFLRCRDLLGIDEKAAITPNPELRTKEYYKRRPCADIVQSAAEILESTLKNNNIL